MLRAVEPGRSRPLGVLAMLVIGALAFGGALALWPAPPPARAADGQITLAVHISLAPTWFDPAETAGVITPFLMLYALHDALVKPMPGNAWTPSLAESWTQSKDGLIYEFALRKGVRFHNGDLLTAEDVKFSFERYKGAAAGTLKAHVAAVEIVDAHRVRFRLKQPWGDHRYWERVHHRRHPAGGLVMTANDPERHYPGAYYSCDARNAEGDRRLCPMHEQAPTALKRILAILEDDDLAPAEMLAEIRTLALRALGA
jgi:hypothetical protein